MEKLNKEQTDEAIRAVNDAEAMLRSGEAEAMLLICMGEDSMLVAVQGEMPCLLTALHLACSDKDSPVGTLLNTYCKGRGFVEKLIKQIKKNGN